MVQLLLSFGLWWGVTLVAALLLVGTGLARLNVAWLGAAMGSFAIYTIANSIGGDITFVDRLFPGALFNWGGKLAEVVSVLVMVLVLRKFAQTAKIDSHGLTVTQTEGSIRPAIIATVLLCGLMAALAYSFSPPSDAGTAEIVETLVYQATMPGLSEEPMFRGLLLTTLSLGVASRGVNVMGAKITWGGLLVTVLFAVSHGVFWGENGMQVFADGIIVSGFLGFWLLWIRQRTGSLLIPVIAHNLINVSSNVAEFLA